MTAPIPLDEMSEKSACPRGRSTLSRYKEPQGQDHGITIALDRMAAHAAERRYVFLKEADD
jgi:hypothetical protein